MNFPGLDFTWSSGHHAARAVGLLRPWSLEECRAGVARGDKVLVVATTALGDSLLTLPLIQTLSDHLGRARVSLLVRAPYAELYANDPRIGRVFTVQGKYRWGNLPAELKAEPHRLALLANITEPDLIPCLWWCGVRGFLRYQSRSTRFPRWMANSTMLRPGGHPEYAQGHAIENNLAMAQALGLVASTHQLGLPHLRLPGRADQVVMIHPGASRANKRWPVENWARLADAVLSEVKGEVWLTGTAQEGPLCLAVLQAMKSSGRCRSVAGNLPLIELARFQSRARAFISGDTGPYHLAVAVGSPTVTLFAPTDRGSSLEACGPHQADLARHRAIQTENFGDPVASLSFERVWPEVRDLLKAISHHET